MRERDVIIVGGGVAGLSCAAELRRLGVSDTCVIERESEAGGIPRHCGHWGFGLREFGTLQRGPDYAKRLVERANGVDLRLRASVAAIKPDGKVVVNSGSGVEEISAKAIVLATGARETPRSARLISGARPPQIVNTGALQQMIYLHRLKPFESPVVIGSELVSFSALLTLRHAGIRARAMIEENRRITARRPGEWIARLALGVPVLLGAKLTQILGVERVEAVEIERGHGPERIACDGVVLTGRFRPENALIAGSHLGMDAGTRGPAIDQFFRCSDPHYFAAGNMLRAIETAGQCWREGRALAHGVTARLDGKAMAGERINVNCSQPLAYVYPQMIDRAGAMDEPLMFKARVKRETKGRLRVLADGREIWSRPLHALPERRIGWRIDERAARTANAIDLRIDEK